MVYPEEPSAPKASTKSCRPHLLLVACIVMILILVLLYPFSQSGRQWSELFNLAHAPCFFAVMILVSGLLDPSCVGLPKTWFKVFPMNALRLLMLFSLLLVTGSLCELMQGFFGRLSSANDALANASGLSAGLFWCFSRMRAGKGRYCLTLITAGLLIVPSWSPIVELRECYLQQKEFPLLASFERPEELHVWNARESVIRQSSMWATHGSISMQIQGLSGTKYSGAVFTEPVPDWHEFNTLELDLLNPGDKSLTLRITISDEQHQSSGYAPADRFKQVVELPPQRHVPVTIKLADVRSSPATRLMDLSRIESLNLFLVRPETDFEILVDNVRLTNREQ